MSVQSMQESPLLAELEKQTDEALRRFMARAREILAARDEQRKKSAVEEIRRIAKAHGLDIAVKKPGKRGRPPKNR